MRLGRTRKTYINETGELLDYIERSLDFVEDFVKEALGGVEKINDALVKGRIIDFDLVKRGLSWLYMLAKEAIDADTLSIPYCLTTFLNSIAREVYGEDKVRVVVIGGSDLMYYKYNLGRLREVTRKLQIPIPKYPELPEKIGILKFPYCASREVLVNCILFHEMGHYIYEKIGLHADLSKILAKDLWQFFVDKRIFAGFDPKDVDSTWKKWRKLLNYVKDVMTRWADEMFADIFAIRLIGPAFHLACRELEQILPSENGQRTSFSRTHPADKFRFKIHAKWLSEGGWDKIIRSRTPEVFEELEACKGLEVKGGHFSINCESPLSQTEGLEKKLHKWMLKEFRKVVVKVEEAVEEIFPGQEKPIDDFNKNDFLVTRFLEHGIVPSTVYDEKTEEKRHPKPTTVLNSGFFFYLSGMKELLSRVEVKDDSDDVKKRLTCEKRLNEWLGKAIDDWQILKSEGKV